MPNSFWRIPIKPSHRNLISQFLRSLFLTIMSPKLVSIQFVFEHKPIWYLASNSCPFDIWGFSVVLPSSLIGIQNHRYQNYSYSLIPSGAHLFFLVILLKDFLPHHNYHQCRYGHHVYHQPNLLNHHRQDCYPKHHHRHPSHSNQTQ